MTEDHSIWDVTERVYTTYGFWHSFLWLKTTVFEMSQRGSIQPMASDTVSYDWRPQYLRCHREALYNLWLLTQFLMTEDHSIWDVAERLYATYYSHSLMWLNATVFEFLNIDNLFSTWSDQSSNAHIICW